MRIFLFKSQKKSQANKLRSPEKSNTPSPTIQDFYTYFKEINSAPTNEQLVIDPDIPQAHHDNLNMPISESEINKCITNLQNSKSPSPTDDIFHEYIKTTKDIMLLIYTKLFNCVFNTGFIPNTWLEGIIMPIYKNKGDPNDPSNYRPITILSCLGKLFTSILNQRLTTFLEESNILNENEAGFRKGYSCSDHIFTLKYFINILKKKTFCCLCRFFRCI